MSIRFETLDVNNYKLARGFRVNPVLCENPEHFTEYLLYTAMSDQKKGLGTTHLLIDDEGESRIVGYITLRASSYIKEVGMDILGYPALEIFELATADGEERRGTGTTLVNYAIATAMNMRQDNVGVRYILLRATKMAVPFYEKIGFKQVDRFGEVPKDAMNQGCVPMHLLLPEEQ